MQKNDITENYINVKKIVKIICNDNKQVFGNFYSKFLEYYFNKMIQVLELFKKNNKDNFNIRKIIEKTIPQLISEIQMLSIRTLIVDINEKETNKLLQGNSSKDKYKFYNKELLNEKFIAKIFEQYPVLENLIINLIENRILLIQECLTNLHKDKEKISDIFNIDIKNLIEINISTGDSHNNGKKVVLLNFKGGLALVYKPHSLSPENLFNQIVSFLNNAKILKHDLKAPKCINRENYGWQEFVDYKECDTKEDIIKYYYRIGCLLAIFNLLSCSDIHYENIIVYGGYPLVIDLETLINNDTAIIKNENAFFKTMFKEYSSSVLGTMLLPTNSIFSCFDFDIGGISNSSKTKSKKWEYFQLKNEGTLDIQLEKGFYSVDSDGKNLLKFKGKIISPLNYSNDIQKGFYDCYNLLIKQKTEILNIICSEGLIVRQVLLPTAIYAKFLEASTFPSYLTHVDHRKKLFSKFKKLENKNTYEIEKANLEIESLMKDDVPYFYTTLHSTSLYSGNKEVKNFYKNNLLYIIANKINNLNNDDLEKQMLYIRMSLETIKKPDANQETSLNKQEKLVLSNIYPQKQTHNKNKILKEECSNIDCINKIANTISKSLIYNENKDCCSMLYPSQETGDVIISVMDGHLYGYGGLILLYAFLGYELNVAKYINIAKALLKGLKEHGMINKILNMSAFTGIGSYIYIYYTMYALFKEKHYYNSMMKLINDVKEPNIKELDLISGVSGTIIVLLNIYKNIKEPLILSKAIVLSDVLYEQINNNQHKPLTGLAHGLSGYALALIKLGVEIKSDKFIKKGFSLIKEENKFFNYQTNNWSSNKQGNQVDNFSFWCYGAAGIGLSRIKIKELINEENELLTQDIEKILNKINSKEFFEKGMNHSLCHGSFGNIDILLEISTSLNNENLKELVSKQSEKLLQDIKRGIVCGGEVIFDDYSFMLGLSGIAYTLLRINNPEYPSILSLDVIDLK